MAKSWPYGKSEASIDLGAVTSPTKVKVKVRHKNASSTSFMFREENIEVAGAADAERGPVRWLARGQVN